MTPREEIIDLLERRVRGLAFEQMVRRRKYDASILLHYLHQTSCVIAMKGAYEYLEAARAQIDRIEQSAQAWHDLTNRSRVFHEVHYYFICWAAIWKRLNLIKARSALTSLKPVLQKYRVEAEDYVLGRDQLEHYDDWLDGRARHRPLAAWDAGNLVGEEYSLGGRRWNVSRSSLYRLEMLVGEFATAVQTEGISRLIAIEMNKPLKPSPRSLERR